MTPVCCRSWIVCFITDRMSSRNLASDGEDESVTAENPTGEVTFTA